jgi:hypothetical protein
MIAFNHLICVNIMYIMFIMCMIMLLSVISSLCMYHVIYICIYSVTPWYMMIVHSISFVMSVCVVCRDCCDSHMSCDMHTYKDMSTSGMQCIPYNHAIIYVMGVCFVWYVIVLMMKLCIMIQLLIIDYIHAYTHQALSRLCALQSLVCKACVVTTLVYLHICISEHIQLMLTR